MKSVRYINIGGYKQVLSIEPRRIDPERTKLAAMQALGITEEVFIARNDFNQLVEQYAVYPEPMAGEAVYGDNDPAVIALESKFKSLTEKQILDFDSAEIIPDLRGTKYHLKTNGVWAGAEITAIGVALPGGAVLPDNLTAEQQAEIAEQAEAARVAALTPVAKAAEKQNQLNALADEADRLSRRAQIQGESFDAAAWYQEHKAPVEEKYA
jgi:hypothetical protein